MAQLRRHTGRLLRELTEREAILSERDQDSLLDVVAALGAANHFRQQ